ncbi:hypothetical protein ACSQ76_20490 [Roseovarius sp. B08]|uniref:hypothetical protein n=1 Tax=Roseovarius sp. B08 TaxID=3449223 RepID=UPI003EDBFDDF
MNTRVAIVYRHCRALRCKDARQQGGAKTTRRRCLNARKAGFDPVYLQTPSVFQVMSSRPSSLDRAPYLLEFVVSS